MDHNIAAIRATEIYKKYLASQPLETLKEYVKTGELRLKIATQIFENLDSILQETSAKFLLCAELSNNLYSSRRYRACIRALEYCLRYATYAMLANSTSLLDRDVLKGREEIYSSLEISTDVIVGMLHKIKEAIASVIGLEAEQEIAIYIDYIIKSLQNDIALRESEFIAAMQAFEKTRKNYRNALRELAQ
ncbi:allophycocyanin subunit beta [Kamptonema cortianum]|uniref:Allophycocyanin subunit beta n=1 Tax=Geitlerinema calcuttense NRMC-F 0142 TaxID=2922238 RepID=A0ABT7LYR9_9CYAN|nr:allophycocyanin subunit beta [Geitlerinema calcuttense]MDK3155135.1 allophycocyanin subunit beta [Kamptonema cortianum]MDL5057153.1 allophycocyanin subunit beta [Geitlerinema calcuttense NRMC-F 0142]